MVFLRPRILRDNVPSNVSAKRYDAIRAHQAKVQEKGIRLMPEEKTPMLPSLKGFLEQLSTPVDEDLQESAH